MLIAIVLPIILMVIMFALGLGLRPRDFGLVAAQPKAFGIGALNQVMVVPLAAFALAKLFHLPGEMALGLMILSACPGGVLSNAATKFAEGNVPLSVSLTAVISLVSIMTVPLVASFSAAHFLGAEAPAINVTALGVKVFLLTAVPVGLGMVLTHFAPRFVQVASPRFSRIAFWLFLVTILAALADNWDVFARNFWSLGPTLVALNAILLTVGLATAHLARLSVKDATTIAIESGTQNGALGIAAGLLVAGASSGLPATTVPAVVYSITAWLLTMPFVFWRRRLVLSHRWASVQDHP